MEKKELRLLGLQQRESLSPRERKERDSRIKEALESLPVFRESKNVLLYYSIRGEAGTHGLIQTWGKQKHLFLPRLISSDHFLALPFKSVKDLTHNTFGIPEPQMPDANAGNPELDLIIVPGVLFDRGGNRIGMGKGYYDRFLKLYSNTPKIALAYSEQVLEKVPHKPYDEPVDMIVTESDVIRCKS